MLAHVIVSGRVQGVGFRFSTQQQAGHYHLNGWVQNKSDGTVELEVEGRDRQVHTFLNELKKGFSPSIKVTDMQVDTQQDEKGYSGFSIK
ncbi:acylphosphatase [Lentibacillus salicampi]|uniref:Acylphosphatase n=1 Tax=Lentibacillus salicampi TaxID=175306 RepID=A0A4Y9AEU1_9BACI|nr:acylphosphatase [Lentibacillus salicampi]TFJ93862.1 acylphosphatase [Lentibacillus salicampi]